MKLERQKLVKRTLIGLATSIFVGALSASAMAQSTVNKFDNGYLSEHPEVAQQLAANPTLVDNHQFLANHQGLVEYFQSHPQVREEIKTHPREFMAREDQMNNWHGRWAPPAWGNNWNHGYSGWNGNGYGGNGYGYGYGNGNPGPAQRFDNGYLHSHPDVAQQLAANPALIDNPQYMKDHPGLRQYLAAHPQVRQDLREHPRRFMSREDQLNGWHPSYNNYGHGHPLANTDNYFDHNPGLQQQLAQNPKLVDNPQFMANHPGLQQYLTTHPEARQQWQNHPYRFMHHENQYNKAH